MAKTIVQEFTKGLWEEIPPFRLVLGLCPVLAVTKTVENGIGMGVASGVTVNAPRAWTMSATIRSSVAVR